MTSVLTMQPAIAARIDELDEIRQAYLIKRRTLHIVTSVSLATVAALAFTLGKGFILLFALPIIAISLLYYFAKIVKYRVSYSDSYKNLILPEVLSLAPGTLEYRSKIGIPRKMYIASRLFSEPPSDYRSGDLIEGMVGLTNLQISTVIAHTGTGDKKDIQFSGVLLIADFHKHFEGFTCVYPDVLEETLGKIGRSIQDFSGPEGTKLIQLEDPDFERAFEVHSTCDIEARYILSTALMDRILELRKKFGKHIRIVFRDSYVIVALRTKHHLLDPDIRIPASDARTIQKLRSVFFHLTGIVETLNLNTRIWSRV